MCCRRNFGKVRLYRTFPVNTSTTSIPHTQRRSAATMVFPNTAPRTLSRIENLPTEIVQHIASYLIHESYYPANSSFEHLKAKPSSVPDGLLELRETSHTMVAKVEHVFKRLFTVKTLTFHRYSLKRLVQLSHSPAYSPLVKTLVFMPMSEAWHETSPYMANWRATDLWKLEEVMEDDTLQQLQTKNTPETSLLTVALRAFAGLKTLVVSPGMQLPWSASVRRHSLLKHPPTMIMAAVMQSATTLKTLSMLGDQARSSGGLKPRIMNSFKPGHRIFSHLSTLDLVLTSHSCKSIFAHTNPQYKC
jgi:hypothetical protein